MTKDGSKIKRYETCCCGRDLDILNVLKVILYNYKSEIIVKYDVCELLMWWDLRISIAAISNHCWGASKPTSQRPKNEFSQLAISLWKMTCDIWEFVTWCDMRLSIASISGHC